MSQQVHGPNTGGDQPSHSSVSQNASGDGFLGEVAQWTREDDRRSTSALGGRPSRLLGGLTRGFGAPSSPPSGPSPRPPSPTRSISPSTAPPRSPFARAASRFSTTANLLRKGSNASLGSRKSTGTNPGGGTQVPPSPTVPESPLYQDLRQGPAVGLLGQPLELRQRKSSLPPTGMMQAAGFSPPASPTIPPSILGGPQISPRTTSLHTRQAQPPPEDTQSTGSSSFPSHPFASLNGHSEAESSSSSTHDSVRGSAPRESFERVKPSRTPSRLLLQSALDLAQQAVEMDRNNDVVGALAAYKEAVDRLRSVMDRVGVDPSGQSRRSKSGKSEEEGRTLKGIHDAYVERIRLLSSYEETELDVMDGHDMALQASTSTATLLAPGPATSTSTLTGYADQRESDGHRDGHGSGVGDRTPRLSTDSVGAEGIGSMMLDDRYVLGSNSTSPSKRAVDSSHAAAALQGSPSRTPRAGQDGQERQSVMASPDGTPSGYTSRTSTALQRATSEEAKEPPNARGAVSPRRGGALSPPHARAAESPPRPSRANRPNPPAGPARNLLSGIDAAESGASARIKAMRAKPLGLDEELGAEEGENEERSISPGAGLDKTPRGTEAAVVGAAQDTRPVSNNRASVDKSLPPLPPVEDEVSGAGSGALINPSTAMGTISQRRQSRPLSTRIPVPPLDPLDLQRDGGQSAATTGSSRRSSVASSTAFTRSRSESQSAYSISGAGSPVPPVPDLPQKTGLSIVVDGSYAGGYAPRSGAPVSGTLPTARSYNGSLISPVPEVQPREVAHRCFHLLRAINQSMDSQATGAYLTGAVHLPPAMWSSSSWSGSAGGKQAGVKVHALETKIRSIDQLVFHLEIIRRTTGGLLDGAREFAFGSKDPRIPSPVLHRDQVAVIARDFEDALEAFEEELDLVSRALSKAGIPVGHKSSTGAATSGGKKKGMSGWGSKLSKAVERKDKASEDPEKYVELMSKLCWAVQIIDDHLLSVTGPCTPAYHSLTEGSYHQLEAKLYRCAESVGSVVVPFVLDDTKQFLLRYLKGGIHYLEDG